MSTVKPKEILVFIASPGDLAEERKVFEDTIGSLNGGFADGAGVRFIPLGWENVLAQTGRRAQTVIDLDVERCDLFILALHRRWGQDAPDSKFSSYTEEEFKVAFNRWKKKKSPEVLVFFKNVDAASLADQGPQLNKVLRFKKRLEKEKHVLYRTFNTAIDFGQEIDRHLRAFARNEWENLYQDTRAVDLPKAQLSALRKANREGARRVKRAENRVSSPRQGGKGKDKQSLATKVDLSLVKAYQEELALARAAAEAADDGRIEDARILFAKATEGTTNPSILALAAEFFRQLGDMGNAASMIQRQAAITQDRMLAARHYLAMLPSGFVAKFRQQIESGLLAGAEPEFANMLRSVNEEIYGGGRLEELLLSLYVKHFSTAELMEFSRFLATAEGQSSLQKQPLLMLDLMNVIKKEVNRVVEGRGLLNAAPAILQEPKQLTGDVGDSG